MNRSRRGRKRQASKADPVLDSSVESETTQTPSKKGRPRKSLNYYNLANPDDSIEDEDQIVSFTPKHSKNTKDDVDQSPDTSENGINHTNGDSSNDLDNVNGDKSQSKNNEEKGKKYSYTGETVKMLQTLFTTYKNDNLNPQFPSSQEHNKVSGNIICAVCQQKIEKASSWPHHKLKFHNNLAWRIGEKPLDLSDQNFVMTTLNALYKQKKPLFCYHCGQSKKSVVGFLSHQTMCNKTDDELEELKIACEVCEKRMLPVSMISHMKTHTNPKPEYVPTKNEKDNGNEERSSRRNAAKKALQIITDISKADKSHSENGNLKDYLAQDSLENELKEKTIIKCKFKGCVFKSKNVGEMTTHLMECSKNPNKDYTPPKTSNEDNDPTFTENSKSSHSRTESIVKVPDFVKNRDRRAGHMLSSFSFRWTLQFFKEHCSKALILNNYLINSWPLMPANEVPNYLPKLMESCKIDEIVVNSFVSQKTYAQYNFKSMELFESSINSQGTLTIFCGGPITAMAWMPTPFDKFDQNQIIAISTLNLPETNHILEENYKEKGVIQFWDLDNLKNKHKTKIKPTFYFGLIHNIGPIWHLEWCPSGCYNENLGRMGLLAVAGSNEAVYIFSIPFHQTKGCFYKPKPVIKLLLKNCTLGSSPYYTTKISWGQATEHNYIAVGYSNGFVAIYNLNSTSPLLKKTTNDLDCYFPVKYFQAHVHTITVLALHYLNGGCRWLLTGSTDRYVKLWDLNDTTTSIWSVKKIFPTDGQWPKNWLCNLVSQDEACTTMMIPSILFQPCNYLFDHMNMLFSNCTITSISTSDWLNGVLQGNTVGEISVVFPNQLLHIVDRKNTKSKKMMLAYTSLIPKTDQKGALSYQNAIDNYALVFNDRLMENHKNFKEADKKKSFTALTLQSVRAEVYPLQQINKIAFNPNRQASLYYATAYHSGFLRINWMEFLKNDFQIQ